MRTMASSCLQPPETFPAFCCSYKGVFFCPTPAIPSYPTLGTFRRPPQHFEGSGPHPHTAALRQSLPALAQ